MAGSTGGDGEFGLQIAPMLDILFVLLLFFMVSAGAQKKETALLAPLPGKGEAPPGSKVPVRLDLDEQGAVTFNNQTLDPETSHDMPNLVKKLKVLIQSSPDQPVIITPSNSTTQERVVDVLDACKAANVKNIAFGSSE